MSNQLSVFLNLSRWVAAFLVVISHLRTIFFVGYEDSISKSLLMKAFYFVTALGHPAVAVFFVVSGYLVGGQTLRKYRKRSFDSGDYFLHRFSRIYAVLIPALLAGGTLDVVGLQYFNGGGIYTQDDPTWMGSVVSNLSHNLGLETLVGNVFNTQTWLVPCLGSNAPLWSLAYEWWYYILFGMMITGLASLRPVVKFVSALVLLLLLATLPGRILAWGTIWLMGVAVFVYANRPERWTPPVWAGAIVLLAMLVINRLGLFKNGNTTGNFADDFVTGFGYCVLLLAFTKSRLSLPLANVHEFFAKFSYSLYLSHFPMMVLIFAIAHDRFGLPFMQQVDGGANLLMLLLLAALLLYAFVFYLLFERRTTAVRQWLRTRLILKELPSA